MTINNINLTQTPPLSTEIFDEDYFYSVIDVPTSLLTPTVTKTFEVSPAVAAIGILPAVPAVTATYSISLSLESNSISTSGWAANSRIYTVGSKDNRIAFMYAANPATSYRLVKQGDVINGCTVGKIVNYYKTGEFMLCMAEVGGSASFVSEQTYNVNNDSGLQIIVKAGRGIKTRMAILGIFATDYKNIEYFTQYNKPDVAAEIAQQDVRQNFGIVGEYKADFVVGDKVNSGLFEFPGFEVFDEYKVIEANTSKSLIDFTQSPSELSASLEAQRKNALPSRWQSVQSDVIQPSRNAKSQFESNENFTVDSLAPVVDGNDLDTKITITSWREYPQNCGPVTYPLFSFQLKNNDTQYAIENDESKIVNMTLYYKPTGNPGTGQPEPVVTITPPIIEGGLSTSIRTYFYPYTINYVTVNCSSSLFFAPVPAITYYTDGTINSVTAGSYGIFTTADYNYPISKKATWKIKSSTDLIKTVTQEQTGPFQYDNEFTFLNEDVNTTQTEIKVINTIGFTDSGYLAIPSYELEITNIGNYDAINERRRYHFNGIELIYYTGKTSTSFTGCTRGAFGSTPRSFTQLNSRVIDYQRPPVNQYIPYRLGPVD
jgi:hypothetical protein